MHNYSATPVRLINHLESPNDMMCNQRWCLRWIYIPTQRRFRPLCYSSAPLTSYHLLYCDVCHQELGRVATEYIADCVHGEASHLQMLTTL